jgi:uncharacterized membrane protein
VWLNLLCMLPLSLLPFGAALIARHPEEAVALRIYGLLLVAMALTRLTVWLYATNRPHLLFDPIDPPTRRLGVLLVALPAALYVVAILIAEQLPTASMWIYAGAPILYFTSLILSRSQAPPGAAERDFT